jgi:hypothetical protein
MLIYHHGHLVGFAKGARREVTRTSEYGAGTAHAVTSAKPNQCTTANAQRNQRRGSGS